MIIATRYHDISCGHRVVGHESKCRFLHGHNYRIHFHVQGSLDHIGRVLDFSVIKATLCRWLEESWDHKMLMWEKDPLLSAMLELDAGSICVVPFNPTAENMAQYLVEVIGPRLLGTRLELYKVVVEETRKCAAIFEPEKCEE